MIRPGVTRDDCLHVCRNLRAESAAEVTASVGWSRDELAAWVRGRPGLKWTVFAGDEPCAVLGAYPVHDLEWSLFGLGTDRYCEQMREVTRFCRRMMAPMVWAAGARAMRSITLADQPNVIAWLEMLGGVRRDVFPGIGRGGETMVLIEWTREG